MGRNNIYQNDESDKRVTGISSQHKVKERLNLGGAHCGLAA